MTPTESICLYCERNNLTNEDAAFFVAVVETAVAQDRDKHAALLAACKEWLAYMDDLDRYADVADPLVIERRRWHGARVERTRTAVEKAEGKGNKE